MSANDADKVIVQLLMAKGAVDEREFDDLLQQLQLVPNSAALSASFSRINAKLKPFSLEIKSVITTNKAGERLKYHGCVNNDADDISKTFGSKFSELELKYFHDLLEHLSVEGFMNTGEADQKRPVGWSISQGQHSLKKLQSQGWLSRDDRNYWILGARSFLELNLSMKEINPDMEIPQIMIY